MLRWAVLSVLLGSVHTCTERLGVPVGRCHSCRCSKRSAPEECRLRPAAHQLLLAWAVAPHLQQCWLLVVQPVGLVAAPAAEGPLLAYSYTHCLTEHAPEGAATALGRGLLQLRKKVVTALTSTAVPAGSSTEQDAVNSQRIKQMLDSTQSRMGAQPTGALRVRTLFEAYFPQKAGNTANKQTLNTFKL